MIKKINNLLNPEHKNIHYNLLQKKNYIKVPQF
jgi:hypothetical protein